MRISPPSSALCPRRLPLPASLVGKWTWRDHDPEAILHSAGASIWTSGWLTQNPVTCFRYQGVGGRLYVWHVWGPRFSPQHTHACTHSRIHTHKCTHTHTEQDKEKKRKINERQWEERKGKEGRGREGREGKLNHVSKCSEVKTRSVDKGRPTPMSGVLIREGNLEIDTQDHKPRNTNNCW
jgi:hypothetical protein